MTITELRKEIEDTPLTSQDINRIMKNAGLQKQAITSELYTMCKYVRMLESEISSEGLHERINEESERLTEDEPENDKVRTLKITDPNGKRDPIGVEDDLWPEDRDEDLDKNQ